MKIMAEDDKPFDFEKHRLQAIAEYQKARPLYLEYADVVKNVLAETFKAKTIKVNSIERRAKTVDSFGRKAAVPRPDDPSQPRYKYPLSEVTDLAGVRVITFFPKTLEQADLVIRHEFDVIERSDKGEALLKEERLGYRSVHYLVRMRDDRVKLLEYNRFRDLIAEIQVRTILQHAWAEIEHDIQYKSVETIPSPIRRRLMALAGMLEIADSEFQAIQDEDERLTASARQSVREGKLQRVQITPDALKAYLDRKLGADGRCTEFSYQYTALELKRLGFIDLMQLEECIDGYDDDKLSKILWGTRQGQLTRLEYLLLAGMGENYIKLHHWRDEPWFADRRREYLAKFREAGVEIGTYRPPSRSAE